MAKGEVFLLLWLTRLVDRQANREVRAVTYLAFHGDRPVMSFDDAVAQEQTQSHCEEYKLLAKAIAEHKPQ